MGDEGKIKVPSKTPIFFSGTALRMEESIRHIKVNFHKKKNFVIPGGSTLYIETVLKKALDLESKDPGNLEVTGNLGTVMKESIQLAYTYAKSFLTQYRPENEFLQKAQLHLHVPEVLPFLSYCTNHKQFGHPENCCYYPKI